MSHAQLLEIFRAAPVVKWMKARLEFREDKTAVVTLPAREEFIQAGGVVHGAVITFAADTSAWFTAANAAGVEVTTSNFDLNLLQAVPPGAGLQAQSEVVKKGRRLVVVRTKVMDDRGQQVAQGTFTHVVLSRDQSSGS